MAMDETENIVLQSDEAASKHYESKIKLYNSGGFSLKSIESRILVFAHPINDKLYKILALTNNQSYRFTGIVETLSDLEKPKDSEPDAESTKQKDSGSNIGADISKYDIPVISRDSKDFLLEIRADQVNSLRLGDRYELDGYVYDARNNKKLNDAEIHVEISRDDYVLRTAQYTTDVGGSFRVILETSYPLFYPQFCYDVKITTTYQNYTNVRTSDFLMLNPLGVNVFEPDMSWLDLPRWSYLPSDFRLEPRPPIAADSLCN